MFVVENDCAWILKSDCLMCAVRRWIKNLPYTRLPRACLWCVDFQRMVLAYVLLSIRRTGLFLVSLQTFEDDDEKSDESTEKFIQGTLTIVGTIAVRIAAA